MIVPKKLNTNELNGLEWTVLDQNKIIYQRLVTHTLTDIIKLHKILVIIEKEVNLYQKKMKKKQKYIL